MTDCEDDAKSKVHLIFAGAARSSVIWRDRITANRLHKVLP